LGDIQFYDNYLPSLEAGQYKILVTPQLPGIKEVDSDKDLMKVSQSFIVSAPRFNLSGNDIHAIHPAPNSSGQFDTHLPHIVFNKKTLPWERLINDQRDNPWMALLLFSEEELILDAGQTASTTRSISLTVADFLKKETDTLKTSLSPETLSDDDNKMNCFSIKIKTDTFKKIIPYLQELKYLSHVRQINTGDKEILGINDNGWFSVTISNRFPLASKAESSQAPVRNIMHLVSLEGLKDILVNNKDTIDTLNKYKFIKLISLYSWSFMCLPTKNENFGKLLSNIIDASNGKDTSHLLRLKKDLDNSDTPAIVKEKLTNGFVLLPYQTYTGERTPAWYRGPLIPVIVDQLQYASSPSTSSGYMVYDEDNGLFDLSYASAWQIGRSLALADESYTSQLINFRHEFHSSTEKILQETAIAKSTLFNSNFNNCNNLSSAKSIVVSHLQQSLVEKIKNMTQGTFVSRENTSLKPNSHLHIYSRLSVQDKRQILNKFVNPVLSEKLNLPLTIKKWFIDRILLTGIPFYHLIPNAQLLPVESIRFFHIDVNWLKALIDGALSIGIHSERDNQFNKMIREAIEKDLDYIKNTPRSGFIMRSAVVSGWPGLAVRTSDDKSDTKIIVLRMERLSPDILLVLFDNVPKQIIISEPQEQLSFGVSGDSLKSDGFIDIRDLDKNHLGFTKNPNKSLTITQFFRQQDSQVLRIKNNTNDEPADLLSQLKTATGKSSDLAPADFAVEMVRSPEEVIFKLQ
jgi:hypothetical protein